MARQEFLPGGYLDGGEFTTSTVVTSTDHGALAGLLDDDHTQYQKESEKGAANGYAPLNGSTKIANSYLLTGTGNGLDADTVDGSHASSFAAVSHTHALADITDDGALAALNTVGTSQIDNDAVTFAKMQNSTAASKLVGRGSAAGAGDFQEISLGSGLSMVGTTVSATSGEAFPVGSVFIAVVDTNPASLLGYGTWSAFGAGRVMVGQDAGDADFNEAEELGGSKTQTPAGTISSESSHTHSVTSNVTVADHSAHTHSVTSNVSVDNHASHTHTYTQVPNHVHGVSTILRTATTGSATTQVTNAQDTSSTADTTRKTDNPDGGVATGTTNGPSATLTHTTNNPAVTSGNPSITLTHSPTNNAVTSGAGSSHNHTFTGSTMSVVQPYIVCYFWKRTA